MQQRKCVCMPGMSFVFYFFPHFFFVCLFKRSFVKMLHVLVFIIQNKKSECTLSTSSIFHLANIAFPYTVLPHYTLIFLFLTRLTINVIVYFTTRKLRQRQVNSGNSLHLTCYCCKNSQCTFILVIFCSYYSKINIGLYWHS